MAEKSMLERVIAVSERTVLVGIWVTELAVMVAPPCVVTRVIVSVTNQLVVRRLAEIVSAEESGQGGSTKTQGGSHAMSAGFFVHIDGSMYTMSPDTLLLLPKATTSIPSQPERQPVPQ